MHWKSCFTHREMIQRIPEKHIGVQNMDDASELGVCFLRPSLCLEGSLTPAMCTVAFSSYKLRLLCVRTLVLLAKLLHLSDYKFITDGHGMHLRSSGSLLQPRDSL